MEKERQLLVHASMRENFVRGVWSLAKLIFFCPTRATKTQPSAEDRRCGVCVGPRKNRFSYPGPIRPNSRENVFVKKWRSFPLCHRALVTEFRALIRKGAWSGVGVLGVNMLGGLHGLRILYTYFPNWDAPASANFYGGSQRKRLFAVWGRKCQRGMFL